MKFYIGLFFVLAAVSSGCSHKVSSPSSGPEIKPVVPPATVAPSAPGNLPVTTPKNVMIDVFSCTRNGDLREIYTEPLSPTGCKLWYSNKKTDPTAWSSKGTEHCLKVSLRIRNNLEGAGYKCAPVAAVHAK